MESEWRISYIENKRKRLTNNLEYLLNNKNLIDNTPYAIEDKVIEIKMELLKLSKYERLHNITIPREN
jgi:hypothetical protein